MSHTSYHVYSVTSEITQTLFPVLQRCIYFIHIDSEINNREYYHQGHESLFTSRNQYIVVAIRLRAHFAPNAGIKTKIQMVPYVAYMSI